MKKLLAAFVVASSLAVSANATIFVIWRSTAGVDDPTIGITEPDLPMGSLVQLLWTPDAAINSIDVFNPTIAQGNDVVLDSYFTTITGGFFTDGTYPEALASVTEPTFLSGYVYVRVFNSAAPTIGDWYGESELVGNPLTDQDPSPGLADVVDVAEFSTFSLTTEIVPEPSVLALAALGAAVVAVRRFRRS